MTVLFKRLTVFRFLTVPPSSAVHGLPKYDGIPPSTGTDVQHGKINFPEDYPDILLCLASSRKKRTLTQADRVITRRSFSCFLARQPERPN